MLSRIRSVLHRQEGQFQGNSLWVILGIVGIVLIVLLVAHVI